MTNPIIDALHAHGEAHKGTDLGGIIQWAMLHIESQEEALKGKDQEVEFLIAENKKMHTSIARIMQMATELSGVAYDAHPVRDYIGAVDTAPHINIMGSHYKDPDYMRGQLAAPHADLRDKPPREAKAK